MNIGERAYKVLEEMSYERLGGTKEELSALEIIKREVDALGVENTIEDFEVNSFEIESAEFTAFILFVSSSPILSLRRFLSNVRICSRRTIESFARPQLPPPTSICVGSFAFSCWLVIAAAITVGECLLPTSFWTISTGLKPPCSEPTTGLKSA